MNFDVLPARDKKDHAAAHIVCDRCKSIIATLHATGAQQASARPRRVRAGQGRGERLGRAPIAPELEDRIRKALATPARPGVRKIAERFGVNPGTVQRIARPFAVSAVGV